MHFVCWTRTTYTDSDKKLAPPSSIESARNGPLTSSQRTPCRFGAQTLHCWSHFAFSSGRAQKRRLRSVRATGCGWNSTVLRCGTGLGCATYTTARWTTSKTGPTTRARSGTRSARFVSYLHPVRTHRSGRSCLASSSPGAGTKKYRRMQTFASRRQFGIRIGASM